MCDALQESVHYFRYNKADNKLYSFADDVHPRYVTSMATLDYDTVAAGDKFGNFFVLRLPPDVSAQVRNCCDCPPCTVHRAVAATFFCSHNLCGDFALGCTAVAAV
jgi:hypothetical protein